MGSETLVPLLLGGGIMGFVGSVFAVLMGRKNMRADTAKKISEASGGLVTQFQATNNQLYARLNRAERIIRIQRQVFEDLFDVLERQGTGQVSEFRERLEKAEKYTQAEREALPDDAEQHQQEGA